MSDMLAPDLCVIGSGEAGSAAAAGAAALGASVVLIEAGEFGGDLSPLALRAFAFAARTGADHAHGRAAAARAVSEAREAQTAGRWAASRVVALRGSALFVGSDMVEAGGVRVRARRFLVASGATLSPPKIPGLEQIRAFTPQTILDRDALPRRLVVLGAGAIALEAALAFQQFGAQVSLFDAAGPLAQEDPEFAMLAARDLRRAGLDLRAEPILRCEAQGAGFRLHLQGGATIEGDALLVATDARPRLGDLGLDAAGVARDASGAALRRHFRTSNRRVFIAGGAAGAASAQAARIQAEIAWRAALLRAHARLDAQASPRLAPGFAAAGLTEAQARKAHRALRIARAPLAEGDRARASGAKAGHVKLICTRGGRVIGAAILGEGAAEAMGVLQLAIQRRLRAQALADLVAPAGTIGESVAAAARAAGLPNQARGLRAGLLGLLRKFG